MGVERVLDVGDSESVPTMPETPGAGTGVTRVLLVDDHRTFAELLAMALDAQPDISCVGHVPDAAQAQDAVARLQPDVVIVDVRLGKEDGLALVPRLTALRAGLRALVLTASMDPTDIARAAAAGACGYLPKAGALTEVLSAVRTSRPGQLVLPPSMVLDLVALDRRSRDRAGPPPGTPQLTTRERQVLELLGEGLDVNAIAKRLGIRVSTCRGYVQCILGKLDVHTQLEAVVQATALGLIRVGAGGSPGTGRARD